MDVLIGMGVVGTVGGQSDVEGLGGGRLGSVIICTKMLNKNSDEDPYDPT